MRALFGPGGQKESLLSSNGCGTGSGPTCTDGMQNGDETGVDCGGSCPNSCPPATCAAPTNTSVNVARNRRKATISWSGGSGALSYTLEYRQAGSSSWSSKATSSTSTNVSGLTPNASYEYRVTANCAGGATDTSPIETFTANRTSSRLDGDVPAVSIFPNPVKDILSIEIGTMNEATVELYIIDLYGKQIMNTVQVESAKGFYDVDLSELEAGVYFLIVRDGAERHVEKFLRN